MVSLVIVTAYMGNLVAAHVSQHVKLPFRTLEELAEDDQYSVTLSPGHAVKTLLEVMFFLHLLLLISFYL